MKDFDNEPYEVELAVLGPDGTPVRDAKGDVQTAPTLVSRRDRELRDRGFRINGHDFVCRMAVSPEAIISWSKMIQGEIEATEEVALSIYDETVQAFLEPGQEEDWRRVRDPDAVHPINLTDLRGLVAWLFEAQTGRPTARPAASSPGAGGNATRSTEDSSSLEVVGSAV